MWEKKELVDLIRQTKPLFTDEAKISRIIQKGKSDYELFYAERGEGAFLDDRPICVSAVKRSEDSLIFLGSSPYEKEKYGEMIFRVGKRIYDQYQDIRSLGSAALELAYVACGRADGYFERELKPWDFAAGALILQEAGGRVLNWDRKPLCYYEGSSVLADNEKMGDWMLDALEP